MNRTGILILWLLAMAAGGCNSHPPVRVAADLSGPKAAAVTFFRAVSVGDVRTARDASVGSPQEKQWIDAMATMLTGLRSYDEAVVRRFGHEATQTDTQVRQALMQLVQDPIERLQDGLVKEGADTAEVDPGWKSEVRLSARPPVILQKEKGLWKVDLAATAKVDPKFDPETVERYRTYGKALQNAAYQINAGRYKTLAEAERDSDAWAP